MILGNNSFSIALTGEESSYCIIANNFGFSLVDIMKYEMKHAYLANDEALNETDLTLDIIEKSVNSAYSILEMIDDKLTSVGSSCLVELMELANLSSFLGNLIGGGIAHWSDGVFQRNRPHAYPDLLHKSNDREKDIEVKVALETNKPKGHLAKEGNYFTIRYVLGQKNGSYKKGERGTVIWIWELKFGRLVESDFAFSSTAGDSGKTAVINSTAFNKMALIYFDPRFCPYTRLPYPEPGQITLL